MARYLYRNYPRCNGYLSIIIREPGRNVPLQWVNGHCAGCGYRLAWIVISVRTRKGEVLEAGKRRNLPIQK